MVLLPLCAVIAQHCSTLRSQYICGSTPIPTIRSVSRYLWMQQLSMVECETSLLDRLVCQITVCDDHKHVSWVGPNKKRDNSE